MDARPKLEELLHQLGFAEARAEEKPYDDGLLLNITVDEPARLIGPQGATLAALQFLLNRLLFQADPRAPRVTLDVGHHRAQAREELVRKAQAAAASVRAAGEPLELEPMNAYDRRIVHQALKEDPAVETRSIEIDGTDLKVIQLRPRA
ncbi:MAG: protein jag [Limisphaerales bacterium]